MSEDQPTSTTDHEPPPGALTTGTWNGLAYTATAKWLVLRTRDKLTAEVFSTSYVVDSGNTERPVTFVFNGGPGASSAYLHVGALGPQRIDFPADGTLPAPPIRLVHNDESWLAFTDLVFIDPVGTGFSRLVETSPDGDDTKASDPNQYFTTARDLESMCEFIGRWLSDNHRWGSAIFLAGESYGGYRVGRLTRMLQEKAGVYLNGSILISPALEPAHLSTHFGWGRLRDRALDRRAAHHGGCGDAPRAFPWRSSPAPRSKRSSGPRRSSRPAITPPSSPVVRRCHPASAERDRVIARYADLTGLDPDLAARAEGRIRVGQFTRELLRNEKKVLGAYDASITATDPFPDRDLYQGADPTLTAISSAYTTTVNRQLRTQIGVETSREYALLNVDVILAWKNDEASHYVQFVQGADDDFRFGMSLNPHMKAFITHGRFDLMTPYFASNRMRDLMRLDPTEAERLTILHFDGGHMFYAWQESRRAFTAAIATFVSDAIGEV